MKKTLFGTLGLAAMLVISGCETTNVNTGTGTGTSGYDWRNPVGNLVLPPSGQANLQYQSGSDLFHRSLYRSMKGNVPVIEIDMEGDGVTLSEIQSPATQLVQTDPGIFRWVARVDLSGGSILACEEEEPESLWALFSMVVNFAAPWVNEYLMYREAQAYNVVAFYDPGNEVISSMKFIRKDKLAASELTCKAASEA